MELNDLFPVAITFIAIGILLSFGLSVQDTIRDDFAAAKLGANCGQNSSGGTGAGLNYDGCGFEFNASRDSQIANANVSSKIPILGTIIIAAIVVGVLIKAFVFK